MKKLLLFVVLSMFITSTRAQVDEDPEYGSIKVSVMQDLKFATIGDPDRGYDAFTKDFIVRVKWDGMVKRGSTNHSVVFIEYENADLMYGFERFTAGYGRSINIGTSHVFTEVRWKIIPYVQVGGLSRGDKVKETGILGLEHEAIFSEHFAIVANHQFMYRSDFEMLYGTPSKMKYSFHVGIQYRFNIFQPTKTAN